MKRDLPRGLPFLERVLDVIEHEVLPLTEAGVTAGNKIFGAAILRKSDHSLVVAATNEETASPLWHGEVTALRRFFELPNSARPAEKDCLFVATHEPCPLCLSAITWSGFDNFYYLFSHEDSRDRFDIPHDINIMKEVFGLEPGAYRTDNAFWTGFALEALRGELPREDARRIRARIDRIADAYEALTRKYQAGRSGTRIPLP